jgi:hypothetical protein
MRAKVQDVLDWLHHQIKHPSQDWDHMCLSSARQAWDLPVLANSAKNWWARIPADRRHHTTVENVPAGAMCYSPMGNSQYGHAWIAGRNGTGFSVDFRRKGHIDRVPLNMRAWTHDDKVWWTDYVPGHGSLPLYRDPRNHAKWPNRKDG